MKWNVIALTLLLGSLAHASSPIPAVTASLEATPEGLVRLDLRADGAEPYRVEVRQLVASPAGAEAVPLAVLGIGAGEGRALVLPLVAALGNVRRVRYEISATGVRSARTFLHVVDRAFAVAPGGQLRPLSFEEERQLAPPAITLTGEPVPAGVLDELVKEVAGGHAR